MHGVDVESVPVEFPPCLWRIDICLVRLRRMCVITANSEALTSCFNRALRYHNETCAVQCKHSCGFFYSPRGMMGRCARRNAYVLVSSRRVLVVCYLVNTSISLHNLFLVYLSTATCLGPLCAHHQGKQLCLCDTWYLLFWNLFQNNKYQVVSVLQTEACNTDTTPTQSRRNSNTHRTKNNTTNVVIQQNSRKLLMMDILMPETCWAHKKWNKIASDIKLFFHSSTV